MTNKKRSKKKRKISIKFQFVVVLRFFITNRLCHKLPFFLHVSLNSYCNIFFFINIVLLDSLLSILPKT